MRLIVGIFLILSLPALGQNPSKKLKKAYNQALGIFNQQNYDQALIEFQEVLDFKENNQLIENAQFYYALCAYKNEMPDQAQSALSEFLAKYASSNLRDEANYMLADLAFRKNELDKAFSYLRKIQKPERQQAAQKMEWFFLQKQEIPRLRLVLQNNPKDTLIAQVLVDKIAATSEKEDEYILLEQLINDYKLTPPQNRRIEKILRRRPVYKVAMMLPFEVQKVKAKDTSSVSKISMQLYQGMRIAQKELDSTAKLKFELVAYDLNRDSEKTSLDSIFMNQELRDVDFVVGPLFENSFKKLADSALKARIQTIQPISIDDKYIQNRFTYLYHPSQETQVRKSIEFMKKNFRNKSAIVFFDNLAKNRALANLFKETAEKQGLKIEVFEQIQTSRLHKLDSIISRLNSTQIGSIFITSTSQLIALELVRVMKDRIFDVPVFAPDSWLKFQELSNADLEKLNFHFVYPDLLNVDTNEALKFKKAYLTQTPRLELDDYAYLGYEMLHILAKWVDEYGIQVDYTTVTRKKAAESGIVTELIDFGGYNSNQFVPILKIKEGIPELVKEKD
jgi:ABC-type branched-subunit amino acid transport system substrate-binding protein